jgi:prepilin-type N-terminal cleavage/methylation domain-containing protein
VNQERQAMPRFTLIELLVVFVLLGVFAAVVVFALS